MSMRSDAPEEVDDDEEEGRTVVRGAPKIVKRTNPNSAPPASISPAAVIKATLESARANRRRELLPGPPADLLEDRSDFERPRTERAFGGRSSPPMEGPPSQPPSYGPPASNPSTPPPSSHRDHANYANHYSGPHSSANVPGVIPSSMPAHFMTPQAPYSDPPATSVTSGHRVAGRPAVSWAAALLACGLFVGVAAVAVMQGSEAAADTTASFVDPSRAPAKNTNGSGAPSPVAPTPVPMLPNGLPAVPALPVNPAPAANLIGASPVQPGEPVAAPAASVGAGPGGFTPVVGGFAPVAVAPSAPAPKPAAKPAVVWRAPAPAPRPAPKAPTLSASNDDDAPKKEPKKRKSETDDETKKALEALQKAQLESASSFGSRE